jgi:hypothetical protein
VSKPARRRSNPSARRITGAIGLGLSIAGVGLAFADIYRRPAVAVIGAATGLAMTIAYWPDGKQLNIFTR